MERQTLVRAASPHNTVIVIISGEARRGETRKGDQDCMAQSVMLISHDAELGVAVMVVVIIVLLVETVDIVVVSIPIILVVMKIVYVIMIIVVISI